MNIITTQNYVAGIFTQWSDVQHYLSIKPDRIRGFQHINIDLSYPFYLVETADGRFLGYQTEAEASDQPAGIILYTIEADYQPEHPWCDCMGSLEHEHLGAG